MQHVPHPGEEVGGMGEDLAGAHHAEHAVQVAAADQRKEVQMEREDDEEEDPQPEDGHGEAEEGDDAQRIVDERIAALQRGDDPDRDTHEGGHDGARRDQHEGMREHARDVLADRVALAEGSAEVEPDRAPEVVHVLHGQGPVQPEVLGAVGEGLGGRLVAHHGHAGIARQDAHGEEDDAHGPEQHGHRDQEAPQHVLEHGSARRAWPSA